MDFVNIESIDKAVSDYLKDIIEENPYMLCGGDIGISFDRADRIAARLNKPDRVGGAE